MVVRSIRWTTASALAVASACAVAFSCSSFGAADSPPEGGVTDGAVSEDGAPTQGPFCAQHPGAALCDDFDDPRRSVWRSSSVDDAGTLEVRAGGVSPPNALSVTMAVPSGPGCHDAFETGNVNVDAPNGFHLEFKLLPGGAGEALPTEVAIGPGVTFDVSSDKCEYFPVFGPTTSRLDEEHNGPTATATTTLGGIGDLKPGEWNAVSIDVEGASPNRVVSLRINGELAITKQPVDSLCQKANYINHMSVGIFCADSNFPKKVVLAFDDVLLTVR